jgi:hypothetical protein
MQKNQGYQVHVPCPLVAVAVTPSYRVVHKPVGETAEVLYTTH